MVNTLKDIIKQEQGKSTSQETRIRVLEELQSSGLDIAVRDDKLITSNYSKANGFEVFFEKKPGKAEECYLGFFYSAKGATEQERVLCQHENWDTDHGRSIYFEFTVPMAGQDGWAYRLGPSVDDMKVLYQHLGVEERLLADAMAEVEDVRDGVPTIIGEPFPLKGMNDYRN